MTAAYGRGQWCTAPELGVSDGRMMSRSSESAAKAAKAGAALCCVIPANPSRPTKLQTFIPFRR